MQRTKFSEWLRKEGYTSRLFSRQLAKELGRDSFSTNTIDNWRTGRTKPRDETMRAVLRITPLSASDFLVEKKHP